MLHIPYSKQLQQGIVEDVVRDLTVSTATACAGFPPADAESKGKDASEIPHKPWEWKDNQVRVTRLAGMCFAFIY